MLKYSSLRRWDSPYHFHQMLDLTQSINRVLLLMNLSGLDDGLFSYGTRDISTLTRKSQTLQCTMASRAINQPTDSNFAVAMEYNILDHLQHNTDKEE